MPSSDGRRFSRKAWAASSPVKSAITASSSFAVRVDPRHRGGVSCTSSRNAPRRWRREFDLSLYLGTAPAGESKLLSQSYHAALAAAESALTRRSPW